ncbi:CAP domain-containing protein [Haloglomus litoreum]|uniref:CAP domain-containing protein n=1 Tax=Haloglomus litoreum TaxID=3034026 RepID=UPI0023E781D7|nr:CAP domain-containing protein [Haloglomus sp. DT116]
MPEFDAIESDDYERIEPFERAVFEAVNESREAQGLVTLEWDGVLAYISRLHSRNMSQSGFFSHTDNEERGPRDRIKGFNYACANSFAENLYKISNFYSGYEQDIENIGKEAVSSWKHSPEHREVMWSEVGGVAGVGCYINADNDVYVTNLFCSHDPADAEDAGTGTPPEDCYYGGERP